MSAPLRLFRLHLYSRLFSTTSSNPNPEPFSHPIRHLIKPILKATDPDVLHSLFTAASASDPRFRFFPSIYSLAVNRLHSLDRPDLVISLLDHQKSLPDFSDNEHFAARIILLFGRAHLLDHALSTFHSLPFMPSSLSLNALLSAFSRNDPSHLPSLLQQIRSKYPSLAPSVVSYNIIISALCDKAEFDMANEVLKLMENKEGISPNLVTFNTLLNGFYKAGRVDDAERIWGKMEEKDAWSYNAKMRGLCFEKRYKDVVEVFEEMKGVGIEPDVHSYNALVRGYCESGMLEEAKKVYLGCKGEWAPNLGMFKLLLNGVMEAKEFNFAVRLCNECLNSRRCHLDVKTLQDVVDVLVEEKMYEKAKNLVKHVRSKGRYGNKCLKLPLHCLAAV